MIGYRRKRISKFIKYRHCDPKI